MRRRPHPLQYLHRLPEPTLRLAASCPQCGSPPSAQIAKREKEIALQQDPCIFKQSVQCFQCNLIYPITARAYQEAA